MEATKIDKQTAHAIVQRAIKNGILEKRPCSICGNLRAEAHHEDYEKPLEVIWLCKKHHEEHHHNVKKTQKAKGARPIVPLRPPQWVHDIKSGIPYGMFAPFVYAAIRHFIKLPAEEQKNLMEAEYRFGAA